MSYHKLLGSTPALAIILAHRIWQGGAGLITVLIVTQALTPDEQGWYYSFLSVAALYTLFDLGLSLVLVQNAAHASVSVRWSRDGHFKGEGRERLATLIAFSARHYAVLALGFLAIILPAGWVFFSVSTATYLGWQSAWIALALATSGALLAIPYLAVTEGSGEVAGVAGVRLAQAVLGSLAAWTVLLSGGGLWATAMPALAAMTCTVVWLLWRRRGILGALCADPQQLDWRAEIWPLQWRLGLSWLSGYLLTQIHTIVLFSMSGPVAAGQMGLSMTIGNMIGLIAQAFIARHVPAMAKAAARKDWAELDGLFRRDFRMSVAVFVIGNVAATTAVFALSATPFGERTLAPLPFAGLLVALFLGHTHGLLAAQLRSYRREPLIWVAVSGAVATLLLAPLAAYLAGTAGVVLVMLLVQLLLVTPWSVVLFLRRNAQWRAT